jgi:hypothetical protein
MLTWRKNSGKHGLSVEARIAGIGTLGLKVLNQGMQQDPTYAKHAVKGSAMEIVRQTRKACLLFG